jgi:hypothetical protein
MSLRSAIDVALRAAAKADGRKVTIRRGETEIPCVPFLTGESTFETIDAAGAVVTVRSRDFLIQPEHYDFGDGPVEPARGDQIDEEHADGVHTFELLDLPGQPSWRWSNGFNVRYRLHTKEIAKPA